MITTIIILVVVFLVSWFVSALIWGIDNDCQEIRDDREQCQKCGEIRCAFCHGTLEPAPPDGHKTDSGAGGLTIGDTTTGSVRFYAPKGFTIEQFSTGGASHPPSTEGDE